MTMPFHSIIIPHRNRQRDLSICLWSLGKSAEATENLDFEVLVIDDGSDGPLPSPKSLPYVAYHIVPTSLPLFNKPRLLNIGIDRAQGEVLTFLDADAVVGRLWLDGVLRLRDQDAPTRLCYRVRYLEPSTGDALADVARRDLVYGEAFSHYEAFSCGFEGYGEPYRRAHDGTPVFGNSQYSLRRDVLGEIRHNEAFDGRGFEDLWTIREIYRCYGTAYQGAILTDSAHALFHIRQDHYEPYWHSHAINQRNELRYKTDRQRKRA